MGKKRRSLTLLEVVIALSLTSVLLVILFGMFREITVANIEVENLQNKFFAREKVQMRLTQLFSQHQEEGAPKRLFHSDPAAGELTFSLKETIDRDQDFCKPLKAELFLSKKKNLELHLSPIEDEKNVRRELLMENIQKVSYLFFDVKKGVWREKWTQEEKNSPVMVKMVIKKEKQEEISFAFFLPSSQLPVNL